jgi:hypothetical protein
MRAIIVIMAGALFGVGCSKSPTEGGARLEQVEKAFGKEGWKLGDFEPYDGAKMSAQKCLSGKIEGVDALVCEFGSTDAVGRGKKATEGWVAQAVTGVALDNGRTTLGLADRARVDPSGKIIHRISQAYRGVK